MAKTFLETGEERSLVAGFDKDHPAGRQTGLGQGWSKEVLSRDAPQNPPACPGSDAGGPEGCRGAVDGTIGAARNFMQRPKRQPSSRQHPVDLGDTEGQDLAPACRAALEPHDAVPKFGQCRAVRGHGHARALVSQVGYVLFLFSIA